MNEKQKEILIGSLLGDASIAKVSDTKARVNISHSDKQLDYVNYLYSELESLCKTPPKENKGKYITYYFNTLSREDLLELYNKFVVEGVKGVPKDIEKLLTPLGLAVWFMDDGTSCYVTITDRMVNRNSTVMLCTDAFTKRDVELLINVLEKKFGIKANLNHPKSRKGYRIYIGTKYAQKFFDVVEPYIIDSMRYKIKRPYKL